jgi:hypothetical protein
MPKEQKTAAERDENSPSEPRSSPRMAITSAAPKAKALPTRQTSSRSAMT